MSMPDQDNQAAIEILLQTLSMNPDLWETRRKIAEILYSTKQYLEAADVLWDAPEIPSVDTDVAFALKILSRARPNRAIRMIYEVVRRNHAKPNKNMAVAKALNDIGMHMEAARFYGAALASDPSMIDLSFERQSLWLDDSGRLLEEWMESDHESKPPLDVAGEELTGGNISPAEIPIDIAGVFVAADQQLLEGQYQSQAQQPVTTNPFMQPSVAMNATSAVQTESAPINTSDFLSGIPTGHYPVPSQTSLISQAQPALLPQPQAVITEPVAVTPAQVAQSI